MATIEEKRASFQRYKADVKERGKPFYPYAMFHDTVMSLVVVGVIIGLACVWYFTTDSSGPVHCGDGKSCLLGPRYAERADPGTTNFVPRPDWYFYFLFYLLRIFKWPNSVFLGTVGIPTILLILLIALPFLDLRRERRLLRRPVAMVAAVLTILAMGVLTYKGAVAKESLASEVIGNVPTWAKRQGFEHNQQALAGAKLFAQSGCTTCHTYLGSGSSNQGAPDLSAIGKGQTASFFKSYVANPRQFGNNIMPQFQSLGDQSLSQIAAFLVASKGPKF
jgi:ubiquinol-cytochrome c reductase cytochrome b subunit/menaquinol-cytochrome c reductase cytochrome b/c subunit